ncbi:MAG: TolC family protein [Gemmatimonadaceae bacterium]
MSHLIPPRRRTLAAPSLIASGRALGAQAEPLSLSTARDAARRASPTIAAAREALAAARGRELQSGAHANPTFIYGREATSRDGQRNAQDIVSLDQPLALGLRGPRRDAARARREAAEARFVLAQLETDYEVTVAYARALAADRRARIAGEAERAFVEALRVSQQRLAAGDVAGYAHRRLRLEAARAATARAEAVLTARAARGILGSLIWDGGTPIAPSALVLSDSLVAVSEVPAVDPLMALAARSRAELRAAAREAEAAAADARLAARERIPVPVVSAGFKTERITPQGASAQALGGFVAGVSAPLPFFDRRAGATEAARAEARRQLATAEAQRRRVVREVVEAHDAYRTAQEQLALLGPAVGADASAAVAAADVAYAEGEITLAEWLDVMRSYHEARASYAALQAEVLIRRAALERAVGAPLTTLPR